jgi:hypothetical protein
MRGGFGGGPQGQQAPQGQGRQSGNGLPGGGFGGGVPGQQGPNGRSPQGPNGRALPGGGGLPGAGRMGEGGPGGGAGGLLNGANVSSAARKLLEKDAARYTWVAASVGSQNAAGYQLATGDPVMAIGGFNGTDPSPTLAQFEKYVADGRIHYFIAGGGFGGGGGEAGTASRISSWVQSTFKKVTAGSATFYDLTQKKSG